MRPSRAVLLFLVLLLPPLRAEETPAASTAPAAAQTGVVPVSQTLTLGREAEKEKDFHTACRLYLAALRDHPGDPALSRALDRAAAGLSRRLEADRQADAARYARDARMASDRNHAREESLRDRVKKAKKLGRDKKYLQASDELNRVLEESPALDEALAALAWLDRKMDQRLKRGRFPSVQHQAALEGILFYNRADYEPAIRSLRLALSAGDLPQDLAAGRLVDYAALAERKRAEQLWRDERASLLARAAAAERDGNLKEARELLDKILQRDPADAEALRAKETLGLMATAVERAVRNEELQKEVPRLLSQGTLSLARGEYQRALESFHRVLEIDPENAEAREQLNEVKRLMAGQKLYVPPVGAKSTADDRYNEGLRLYGEEKYAAAQAEFEAALRLDPKHQEARQALKRLKGTP